MQLSIVVGTYNRLEQLKACVNSVLAEIRTPFVLYVTDAGSTDGTTDYLQSIASEQIRPVLVGSRIGQARAYNEVFDQVTTPYVCWISDDNVIVNAGLDIATRVLDKNPRIGMVGLKVRDLQGPFTDAPYIGGISKIGILNVNQGVLRTELLKDVGGFSYAFKDYGIDPDLTAKVLFSGWEIALTRDVAIHHYRNWSTDKSSSEYAEMQRRQEQYLALYRAKYSAFDQREPTWLAKKAFWRILQKLAPERLHINSKKSILGAFPRDWHNVLNGRYISLLDTFWTLGKDYHLVQRCPKRALPSELPREIEIVR